MIAKGIQKLHSLDARGKFGYSGGFGRITFGYFRFGFYNILCGIYMRKYYYGVPYLSVGKFYRPTNPQTLKQQNWRAVLAYALVLWRNLTDETKQQWNILAYGKRMSGYNLYISKWLKTPTGGFGRIYFGYNVFGFHGEIA